MDEASLWGEPGGPADPRFLEAAHRRSTGALRFLDRGTGVDVAAGHLELRRAADPTLLRADRVVLFARLARRILPPRPALIALVLFAFSDDLIYYSSELKPYSLDLAVGLAISLAAFDALGKPASGRRRLGIGDPRR